MEQDVDDIVRKDSIDVFDDRILNKLRGCNIIPRSPSDFQVFVKSLAGDTISDVVIQEAWKQIYTKKSGYDPLPIPERESELQEHILSNSLESNENGVDSESFKLNSRKVPKQRHGTHSSVHNFNKIDLDAGVTNISAEHPVSSHRVALPSVAPISRTGVNRKIASHAHEEIKQCSVAKSIETNGMLERNQMEEQSSISDCEIIEIVSPDTTGANNSNSGPKIVFDNDGNNSDSGESVEILDSTNVAKKSMKRPCPIHESNKIIKAQHSQEWHYKKQKLIYIEAKGIDNANCENVNKTNQQKNKKERRRKYEMLRSEVKHLKSLLLNVLLSLKCPSLSENEERTDCRNDEKQSRKKLGSKSRSRIASLEKLQASAFVKVNMLRETTKLSSTKKTTAKHTKNSNVQSPIVVEMDSDASDLDNGKRKKFLWRENIVDILRSKLGRWMPVEKLKRIVIARYYYFRGNVSQNTTVKFFRYLHSTAGVLVDGDKAIYSNKLIKISSKSEKKEFVLKTHTTTKKCKVS